MNQAHVAAKSVFSEITQWIFSIRKSTWLIIGVVTMAMLAFAVWAVIAIATWFFGMAREGAGAAPEVVRSTTEQVVKSFPMAEDVLKTIPGADLVLEKLRAVVQTAPVVIAAPVITSIPTAPTAPAAPALRDVSGTDPAMVTRYPGLTRSTWQRDGQDVTVNYEGAADYFAVVDHYVKGFTGQGYVHNVLAATSDEERHEFRKGDDRANFSIARTNQTTVKVSLITRQP